MIENELKYVLKTTTPFRSSTDTSMIIQFYLGDGRARIRSETRVNDGVKCTFTYKVVLPNGELEEIEKPLSVDEYKRLSDVGHSSVMKFRKSMIDTDVKWEIDFFMDPNDGIDPTDLKFYFVMAECEMLEGRSRPHRILPFVQDHLEHAVERHDSHRFASRSLGDVGYAKQLMRQIHHEKGN